MFYSSWAMSRMEGPLLRYLCRFRVSCFMRRNALILVIDFGQPPRPWECAAIVLCAYSSPSSQLPCDQPGGPGTLSSKLSPSSALTSGGMTGLRGLRLLSGLPRSLLLVLALSSLQLCI